MLASALLAYNVNGTIDAAVVSRDGGSAMLGQMHICPLVLVVDVRLLGNDTSQNSELVR